MTLQLDFCSNHTYTTTFLHTSVFILESSLEENALAFIVKQCCWKRKDCIVAETHLDAHILLRRR